MPKAQSSSPDPATAGIATPDSTIATTHALQEGGSNVGSDEDGPNVSGGSSIGGSSNSSSGSSSSGVTDAPCEVQPSMDPGKGSASNGSSVGSDVSPTEVDQERVGGSCESGAGGGPQAEQGGSSCKGYSWCSFTVVQSFGNSFSLLESQPEDFIPVLSGSQWPDSRGGMQCKPTPVPGGYEVWLIKDIAQLAVSIAWLREGVHPQENLLSIDMEWTPEFEAGSSSPLAVIQIASPTRCIILHIPSLGASSTSNPQLAGYPSVGLQSLVRTVLGMPDWAKQRKATMSKWGASELRAYQVHYAALDAFIPGLIFRQLRAWHASPRVHCSWCLQALYAPALPQRMKCISPGCRQSFLSAPKLSSHVKDSHPLLYDMCQDNLPQDNSCYHCSRVFFGAPLIQL
ncbi:MAG: hypothetical protein WDW38_002576 [Sanguina aurantia]